MRGNILGIRLKTVFIAAIIIILLISVSVIHNRNSLADWTPPEHMIGKWSGQSEVFAPFKKGNSPEDWISIQIEIAADGAVTGKIGEAELVDCTVKQNRNRFERFIGIKTDYIISEGYLNGGIVKADTTEKRDITIPFNITDGEIKGSFFEVQSWKYPDPLFPRLTLTKSED